MRFTLGALRISTLLREAICDGETVCFDDTNPSSVPSCWFGRRYNMPHARNLPLPVISLKPSPKTIRRAACGVTSSAFATIPADTNGFAITISTSSGSFEDVRLPANLRSIICRASASRSCSFMPISAAAISP